MTHSTTKTVLTTILCLTVAMAGANDASFPEVLTLEKAKELALENNPSLRAAETRVAEADARVRQAWAAYLPTLDFSIAASETSLAEKDVRAARDGAIAGQFMGLQSQVTSALFGGPIPTANSLLSQGLQGAVSGVAARSQINDNVENYSAGLSATWLLFDGFRREFARALAEIGAEESEAAYDEAQRLLLDGVAFSYYNAQLARERIAIAEADRGFNQRLLKDAKARRRVGMGSLSDELNFEVRANNAGSNLNNAKRQYDIALIGLAALLGRPEANIPEGASLEELTEEEDADFVLPEAETLIAKARATRPDLHQARQASERAGAGVGLQRAAFYPTVAAIASHTAQGDGGFHFGQDDYATTIGINVSLNLFSGGRDKARLAEAKAARAGANRMLGHAEIQVAAQVRQALAALKAEQENLVLQRENAGYVKQNRDLVEKEYRAGQGSLVRLNQAQVDLVLADANLASARVSLRQAWHDLRTATGETLRD